MLALGWHVTERDGSGTDKGAAAHGVATDHVKVWQTVGKLRRRHGLVMSGGSREPGYRVVDREWEARSSVKDG
jgi:hypothetical protein